MILDCTFRDGGYYVNWDFDQSLVKKYLKTIKKTKIDIIELGFRFLPKKKFLGALAYTSDEYLKTLSLPKSVKIAVMVNADDLIKYPKGSNEAIKLLFKRKINSPVHIVRVATHAKDIPNCKKILKQLKQLGYCVYLNIMQVSSLTEANLKKIIKLISNWNLIETLYFADSFGNMEPDAIKHTVNTIRSEWSGNIGFHAHDNKGLALSNCISALKCGVSHLDGTILGMGRGAGNVKIESLLIEMSNRKYGKYIPEPLFNLVKEDFYELHHKYKWGSNIYYHLSAIYNIHPTYIQEMLTDKRYNSKDIISTIEFLKSNNPSLYSMDNLLKASNGPEGNEYGTWSTNGLCKLKKVLILGSGPSTKKYFKAIQQFINKEKPLVLCLNVNNIIPSELINFYVACNDTRIQIEIKNYKYLKKPLIMPISRLKDNISNINSKKILDYGLRVNNDNFKIGKTGCILPKPLALFYAISVAISGGAKQILLAGIDGYQSADPRQQDNLEIFKKLIKLKKISKLKAITPTTFPIVQSSVFDNFL